MTCCRWKCSPCNWFPRSLAQRIFSDGVISWRNLLAWRNLIYEFPKCIERFISPPLIVQCYFTIPSFLPLSLAMLGTFPSSLPVFREGRRG
jgi:hypothetical protein